MPSCPSSISLPRCVGRFLLRGLLDAERPSWHTRSQGLRKQSSNACSVMWGLTKTRPSGNSTRHCRSYFSKWEQTVIVIGRLCVRSCTAWSSSRKDRCCALSCTKTNPVYSWSMKSTRSIRSSRLCFSRSSAIGSSASQRAER